MGNSFLPDLGNCFCKKKSRETERTVIPNTQVPFDIKDSLHTNHKYATNAITTSKYTLLTFIPLNLKKQFWINLANIYFALLVGLNFIPWVNAYSSSIAWIPLAIVVTFTAAKDAYEDFRRHQSDNKFNSHPCTVLNLYVYIFIFIKLYVYLFYFRA